MTYAKATTVGEGVFPQLTANYNDPSNARPLLLLPGGAS